jgi:cysteinyl-tRNA synthetase
MTLFDSVKKTKLPFEPMDPNDVKIYVCGPTVYDDAHLGHARSSVSFDLLRRVLGAHYPKVTFVKNFTDVDDKIIKKMAEQGETLEAITTKYTHRYKEDMQAIGVMDADIEPKATESLDPMNAMITKLMDKGVAYQISNGDIYFDTKQDNNYLSLSHKTLDQNQSRIETISEKRNPEDFALWKACAKDEEVCFTSNYGDGRPGWHLECSAMIDYHLSDPNQPFAVDIHGGGADLLFPHHENEAAQTRCATNQELAKYWVHNGFVNIDGEKMSKSLGNSFFLKDALANYSGEVLRFYLIGTHYRQDFNFNEEDLLASKKRLDKLYRLKKRLFGTPVGSVDEALNSSLLESLSDDLNISKALATIDEMVANANDTLDSAGKHKQLKRDTMANIERINELIGIGGMNPFEHFQFGVDEATKIAINDLIVARNEAKMAKDFTKADELRDAILAYDVLIMDTPQGTFWEKV